MALALSGKLDIILPYAWSSGSGEFAGEFHERQVHGWGDPKLRFSVNVFGDNTLAQDPLYSLQAHLI
jgi:hypothetical protein